MRGAPCGASFLPPCASAARAHGGHPARVAPSSRQPQSVPLSRRLTQRRCLSAVLPSTTQCAASPAAHSLTSSPLAPLRQQRESAAGSNRATTEATWPIHRRRPMAAPSSYQLAPSHAPSKLSPTALPTLKYIADQTPEEQAWSSSRLEQKQQTYSRLLSPATSSTVHR